MTSGNAACGWHTAGGGQWRPGLTGLSGHADKVTLSSRPRRGETGRDGVGAAGHAEPGVGRPEWRACLLLAGRTAGSVAGDGQDRRELTPEAHLSVEIHRVGDPGSITGSGAEQRGGVRNELGSSCLGHLVTVRRWLCKCGPWSSTHRVTWPPARNRVLWFPLGGLIRNGGGTQPPALTGSAGDPDTSECGSRPPGPGVEGRLGEAAEPWVWGRWPWTPRRPCLAGGHAGTGHEKKHYILDINVMESVTPRRASVVCGLFGAKGNRDPAGSRETSIPPP